MTSLSSEIVIFVLNLQCSEMRYFQPWPQGRVEAFILPRSMQGRQDSNRVPLGDSVLSMADIRFTFILFSGSELFDDLFVFALSHF